MATGDPDFLMLAEGADESISSIAEKLGKSEFWVARVLGRETTCSPAEAGQIAEIIGTDPLHTSSLTVDRDRPRSPVRIMGLRVFDKVVICVLTLFVALTVEHVFGTFTLKRERALAVSNVNSQFLIDRYTQAKNDFVALLLQLESARQAIDEDINAPEAKMAAKGVQTLRNRLEVDIKVISSAHPYAESSAKTFVQSLQAVTDDLIDRRIPTDYDEQLNLLRTRFFELSKACQEAMVQTVEEELQEVEDGRFLPW